MENQNPLSPSSTRTLQAYADLGCPTTEELASYLYCSSEAVRKNFSRIFDALKLEHRNRAAALAVAVESGWVTLPPPPQTGAAKAAKSENVPFRVYPARQSIVYNLLACLV
jgi:hypothetical protein